MATDSQALSDEIDSLLVRYLTLLDEYTSLRGSLSSLQSSIYTNIARANFQAERGVSYGREAYDRRALTPNRVCRVTGDVGDGTVVFEFGKVVEEESAATEQTSVNKVEGQEEEDGSDSDKTEDIAEGMEKVSIGTDLSANTSTDKNNDPSPPKPTPTPNETPDPIRMFGFSIPTALRTAQSSSIQLVESSIPRLASISLQMQALEIQIRRARKYRAKALAAEAGSVKGRAKEGIAA
ncbi:hypothetical protein ONS95_000254 [Cadophora gregata]|uniref:uncharacterized protein n=1 Tax=Cadophora gregata TaxID=51156 RepID=UPI0026DD7E80|nr:uncharacterized protein ONS95_000254 [Cadophora gregata]KAK0099525.1 hypothetical protein ONS96_008362 [Cadophora gregata f. sp. sojae]KAK0128278.1 hypothetical protein ONS95_000254 [Cadophora gregata]